MVASFRRAARPGYDVTDMALEERISRLEDAYEQVDKRLDEVKSSLQQCSPSSRLLPYLRLLESAQRLGGPSPLR